MLHKLKQAWKRDRLGVLGVASALVAFVLWAFPLKSSCSGLSCTEVDFWMSPQPSLLGELPRVVWHWFTDERMPVIGAFLALAFLLLLLRRR